MLPAKTLKEVRGMNVDDRTRYFETHARYFADTGPSWMPGPSWKTAQPVIVQAFATQPKTGLQEKP